MYEVEVKVRADHGPVREALAAADAEALGRVLQVDTYYDAPHREFAETDEALRLRREQALGQGSDEEDSNEADGDATAPATSDVRATLTYKGPLVDAASKTRRELETVVEDPETTADLLGALGFSPAATVRKERERHALDGYTVTLDRVEGLGEFVEVETETDEDGVEPAREGAYALLRRLDLDPDEGIRTSYLGLLLAAEE